MKLIVHATDGSSEAREALELAVELAKETHAELACLAVHTPPRPTGKGLSPPISELETADGAEHLAEEAAATAALAGLVAKAYVRSGDPATEIAQLAERLDADLIVVGSRGFGAIHGALVGSVSRGLMKKSKVPVTVVKTVRETARV